MGTQFNLVSLLAVGAGSGIGGILRYLLSQFIGTHFQNFPWGTFAVNILGCLAIGLLSGIAQRHNIFSPEARLFLTVGLCGGFTTFSTFINENIGMLSTGHLAQMLAYTALSIVTGLAMTALGYWIAR